MNRREIGERLSKLEAQRAPFKRDKGPPHPVVVLFYSIYGTFKRLMGDQWETPQEWCKAFNEYLNVIEPVNGYSLEDWNLALAALRGWSDNFVRSEERRQRLIERGQDPDAPSYEA